MQKIIIDEQIRLILPELDEQARARLEENLLEHGCMLPLILWEDILIDGHHRYEIIQKHDLPFNTISLELETREDVLLWVIDFQISQRNLSSLQLSYYRGLRYNTEKKMHGGDRRAESQKANAHNGHLVGSTANRLVEIYGVSRNTIRRDALVATAIDAIGAVSPQVKRDILSEKTHISRKLLQELAGGTEEDIKKLVESIEDGSFKSRQPKTPASDDDLDDSPDTSSDTSPDVSPDASVTTPTETNQWKTTFTKITGDFHSKLDTITSSNDTVAARSALRLYINLLEDLYKNM